MKIKKYFKLITMGAIIISSLTTPVHAIVNTHFADEFKYFNSSKWEKSDGWSNEDMFNCTWRKNNVSFWDNETMQLSIYQDSGNKPYSGGEYRTRDTFGYGLYQVNMKPAKNPGVVSSFFTYTGPTDGTPWDEIDIEFLGKDTTKVQFNYYTNGVGNHEYVYDLGFDASESYHTYAIDWKPNYIAWRVDGKEVYRTYNNIPSHPGKIMLNVWPGINVDSWLGKYDGKTPVTASYNWMAYDPV